jgi:hypothetical protein
MGQRLHPEIARSFQGHLTAGSASRFPAGEPRHESMGYSWAAPQGSVMRCLLHPPGEVRGDGFTRGEPVGEQERDL